MVVAEFLFIGFVVGILTETWLGFLGTFLGLYALYRFTPLSGVLSLVLSAYWGFIGYQLGAATGEIGVGALVGGTAVAVSAWIHRDGFAALLSRWRRGPADAGTGVAVGSEPRDAAEAGEAERTQLADAVIDAEYRVLS